MGFLKGPDFFYSLRFLRLLTMPWEKTGAFKAGIIDKNGKKLKKPETTEEKSNYNTFHKLVFNIRRLLGKVPLGKSTIARYGAALFLIKDHLKLSDKQIAKVLYEATGVDITQEQLDESTNRWYLCEGSEKIQKGNYALTRNIALPTTGDILANEGSTVFITEHDSVGSIFGIPVFKAHHLKTNRNIYIIQEDICRI
jgi:hypothetical protein